MDVLSDIFSALRVEARLYFSASFKGDFAVRLAPELKRIRFHLVREGTCVVTVAGCPPVRLGRGDLVLIPHGAAQILSSLEDSGPALDLDAVLSRHPPVEGKLSFGEAGPACMLLCGFLCFDEALAHPVFGGLPEMIICPLAHGPLTEGMSMAIGLLRAEAENVQEGQQAIVLRTVEILLMQLLRAGRGVHRNEADGFSAALSDSRLARALSAIHANPARPWNIATLAAVAGMSRSRFAHRFNRLVGVAPMAYLTNWRMTRARQLLQRPGLGMAEVAEQCGYQSVPAFVRRFAAIFGIGPGEWRKQQRYGAANPT